MADRESILLVSGLPQLEILCPGEESNPSGMIRDSLTIHHSSWPLLGSIRRILSRVTASGYIFRLTFRSLSDVLYSDECRTKKLSVCQNNVAASSCC